jgi:hypothetical protein
LHLPRPGIGGIGSTLIHPLANRTKAPGFVAKKAQPEKASRECRGMTQAIGSGNMLQYSKTRPERRMGPTPHFIASPAGLYGYLGGFRQVSSRLFAAFRKTIKKQH